MAQRSARARSKLDKISQNSQNQAAPAQLHQHNANFTAPKPGGPAAVLPVESHSTPIVFGGYHGISGSTSFNPTTGILTPSASSIATASSVGSGGVSGGWHGFPFYNKVGQVRSKGAIRTFFEGRTEKTRGKWEDLIKLKKSSSANRGPPSPASSRRSLGMELGGSLGQITEESLPQVKRWEGGGKGGGDPGWDRLKKDPELWFPDGDTLVYLSPKGHPSHLFSQPSFRINSSVLRETGSQFFESSLSGDDQGAAKLPLSVHQQSPFIPPTPTTHGSPIGINAEPEILLQRMNTGGSRASMGASSFTPTVGTHNSGASSGMTAVDGTSPGIKHEIYFPAPVGLQREAAMKYHFATRNVFAVLYNKSLVGITLGDTLEQLVDRLDQYIPPENYRQHVEKQRLAQGRKDQPPAAFTLATGGCGGGDGMESKKKKKKRNTIIDTDGITGNVARVLEYLLEREFDDFRNCPDIAAGMLCFAEKYKLGELWREAFCHCVGMWSRLEGSVGFFEISAITKALIDRASLEIQVRLDHAEARLSTFQYDDMWYPTSQAPTPPPSKLAFEKFRKFLVDHYKSRFGAWPPPQNPESESFGKGGGGFTRGIYLQLQRDFACLYDYLVDRDVGWLFPQPASNSETSLSSSPGQKSELINPGKRNFRADDENLCFTDIILSFDKNNSYPHIPRPYPLVPEVKYNPNKFIATASSTTPGNIRTQAGGPPPTDRPSTSKHGFLQQKRNMNIGTQQTADKAAALAFSDATNIHSLLSSKASNELVDAFAKFERAVGSSPGEFTPAEGRKGRWILIYGVLQTLASVSVDAPGLRWTEGVEYFLNTKLKGTPPWGSTGMTTFGDLAGEVDLSNEDGGHLRSHCWVVVKGWGGIWGSEGLLGHTAPVELDGLQQQRQVVSSTPPGSRSIGVGQGDTTDNESVVGGGVGKIGCRKRKVMNLVGGATVSFYKRGSSMSGDEGDDEADEEEDAEMRDAHVGVGFTKEGPVDSAPTGQ